MAYQNANRFLKKPYSAAEGDASIFTSSIVAAAIQIGDVIRFAEMPPGVEIIDAQLVNDPLGGSTTLNLGFEYVDSTVGSAEPTAFQAAASKASAGKTSGAFHPRTFNDAIIITSTVAGAAITGKVSAIITYKSIGTL
jgi:hypothetical protein